MHVKRKILSFHTGAVAPFDLSRWVGLSSIIPCVFISSFEASNYIYNPRGFKFWIWHCGPVHLKDELSFWDALFRPQDRFSGQDFCPQEEIFRPGMPFCPLDEQALRVCFFAQFYRGFVKFSALVITWHHFETFHSWIIITLCYLLVVKTAPTSFIRKLKIFTSLGFNTVLVA